MPPKVERFIPAGFLILGLVMLLAAALGVLDESVAVAFAVLGVGLVCLGGLASRLAPGEPFEIGASGLKLVLTDLKRAAEEEQQPDDAEVLDKLTSAVDEAWPSQPYDTRSMTAFLLTRLHAQSATEGAQRLDKAWRRRLREPESGLREPESGLREPTDGLRERQDE